MAFWKRLRKIPTLRSSRHDSVSKAPRWSRIFESVKPSVSLRTPHKDGDDVLAEASLQCNVAKDESKESEYSRLPLVDNSQGPNWWKEAMDELLRAEGEEGIVHRLLGCVQKGYAPSDGSPHPQYTPDRASAFAERQRQEIEIDDHNVNASIRSITKAAVDGLMSFKDMIAAATAPCLPASIAASGFMFLIAMASKALQGSGNLKDLIKQLPMILESLRTCQTLIYDTENQASATLDIAFKETFSMIIRFQAKAMHHYESSRMSRAAGATFGAASWEKFGKDLKDKMELLLEIGIASGTIEIRNGVKRLEHNHDTEKEDAKRAKCKALMNNLQKSLYPKAGVFDRNKIPIEEPVSGTCLWFQKQTKYKKWRNQATTNSILYVTAGPGCGKSVLARHLAEQYLNDSAYIVCSGYFKDESPEQSSALSCVCSLLWQVLAANRAVFELHAGDKSPYDVAYLYETCGALWVDSLENLWQTFTTAISQCEKKVVCILDALDECQDADRPQLMGNISSLISKSGSQVKFLVTSRPYSEIRAHWPTRIGEEEKFDQIDIECNPQNLDDDWQEK